MIYSLRGMAFGIGALAVIGTIGMVDRATNWTAAKGRVYLIDRKCEFVARSASDRSSSITSSGRSGASTTDDCASNPDWTRVKAAHEKVVGKALVKVSYTHPKTGQSALGTFKLDGKDDAFYTLKSGDDVRILVNNDDPANLRQE